MITLAEIKEAFELAFDNNGEPFEAFYDEDGHKLLQLNHLKGKSDVDALGESLNFYGHGVEHLVIHLPVIIKMLLDLHAENAELKWMLEDSNR